MPRKREIKLGVLELLKRTYPQDLSIDEVAKQVRVARSIASLWLRALKAEGRIEVSRRVRNAIFLQILKRGISDV